MSFRRQTEDTSNERSIERLSLRQLMEIGASSVLPNGYVQSDLETILKSLEYPDGKVTIAYLVNVLYALLYEDREADIKRQKTTIDAKQVIVDVKGRGEDTIVFFTTIAIQ